MESNKVRLWKHFRVWRAAIHIFALLAAAPLCHSALQFDAIIGYNGVLPKNSWFPVTCELLNDGPTFTGVIEVSNEQVAYSQPRRLRVELPTNTRKRVIIPVFCDTGYHNWSVRLLDSRGKEIAEPNYVGLRKAAGVPVMAVLSRTVAGVPALPEIKAKTPALQPLAVRLQPELFPDNPLTLEGIPLLYVNSERALELSMPQVNALLAWVQRGGHLVIGAEQTGDLSAAEWLRNLLPCDLKSTTQLKAHPEFQQWLRASWLKNLTPQVNLGFTKNNSGGPSFDPLAALAEDPEFESAGMQVLTGKIRDGHVVIGSPATPLAIQAQRGCGRVTLLTFSPEREPFLSWKNRAWFWAKLAEVTPELYESSDTYYENYTRISSDGVFGAMIDSKQIRKLPLGWLLLLLAAYLAVIGPIDHFWLKKINRQMLTWITFPIYVLAFSTLIYLIGFHLRAGDLEWNELNVVDVLPTDQLVRSANVNDSSSPIGEGAVLRGQTYCSIYSPVNNQYPLVGEQPFAALRGEFLDNMGGQSSRASVQQRGNGFEAEAFVPVWTSQLFVSDWLQPSPALLGMTASQVEKGWQITVENNTNRKLTRTHVVLANRIYSLGELPPQKTTSFTVSLEQGRMLTDFVNNNGVDLRNAAQSRRNSFGNNANYIPDQALGAITVSFASFLNPAANNGYNNFATPQGLDMSRLVEDHHGILLAWDSDHSFTKPLNRFNVRRSHRDTLLRLVVPIKKS